MKKFYALPVLGALALSLLTVTPANSAGYKAPGAPVQVSSTKDTITIKGGSVGGAPRYRLQFANNSGYKSSTWVRSTGTSTQFNLKGLKPATNYYVKTSVIDKGGSKRLSSYGKTTKVRTAAKYSAATPVAPVQTASTPWSVSIKGGYVKGTSRYEVLVARGSEFEDSAVKNTSGSAQSLKISGLRPDTNYWVKTRSLGQGSEALSDYSKPKMIRTGTAYTKSALRVASYNICALHCTNNGSLSSFESRVGKISRAIQGSGADVVGLQEPGHMNKQVKQLLGQLGSDWALRGSYQFSWGSSTAIIYRKSKLSPYGPAGGSKINARTGHNMSAAYATFKEVKTNKPFTLVNAHLSWAGGETRDKNRLEEVQNANNMVTKALDKAGLSKTTRVWVGDFNSYSLSPVKDRMRVYEWFKTKGFKDTTERTKNLYNFDYNSFNAFSKQERADEQAHEHFDHVYVPSNVEVLRWDMNLDTNRATKRSFNSDHNLVFADLRF